MALRPAAKNPPKLPESYREIDSEEEITAAAEKKIAARMPNSFRLYQHER
jgi:hypothetical protein